MSLLNLLLVSSRLDGRHRCRLLQPGGVPLGSCEYRAVFQQRPLPYHLRDQPQFVHVRDKYIYFKVTFCRLGLAMVQLMIQFQWTEFSLIYTVNTQDSKCDYLQQDLEVSR